MALDTKLLLVPAAGATRCFLCGWLAARAGMLLGAQARPGAGLLTARPAALGIALAGCCVLWHGLRVGLGRQVHVPQPGTLYITTWNPMWHRLQPYASTACASVWAGCGAWRATARSTRPSRAPVWAWRSRDGRLTSHRLRRSCTAAQHGQRAAWAVPKLGSCASSGRPATALEVFGRAVAAHSPAPDLVGYSCLPLCGWEER